MAAEGTSSMMGRSLLQSVLASAVDSCHCRLMMSHQGTKPISVFCVCRGAEARMTLGPFSHSPAYDQTIFVPPINRVVCEAFYNFEGAMQKVVGNLKSQQSISVTRLVHYLSINEPCSFQKKN